MHQITFDVSLFDDPSPDGLSESRKGLLWLMTALSEINRLYLITNPSTEDLYRSGVLYAKEEGTEIWKDIPNILDDGFGDCEDLACWRIAELRFRGIKARPYIKWRQDGKIYHAVVRWPDGRIEDPSRALGMHGHPITNAPVWIEP